VGLVLWHARRRRRRRKTAREVVEVLQRFLDEGEETEAKREEEKEKEEKAKEEKGKEEDAAKDTTEEKRCTFELSGERLLRQRIFACPPCGITLEKVGTRVAFVV
jgi:hypothetical protein